VPRTTRRTFLVSSAAAAGALLLPSSVGRAQSLARGGRFTLGVAAGQPATNGATLWTKLGGLERTSRLQVEIARDDQFRNVVYRQDVLADAERDFTVHHRAEHPVLAPGEQFFYRFYTCDENSPVGRFRTALPPDSREPVRVGFFSCQKYTAGYYTAHAGLAAEPDLDLVVCLGDYIYEELEDEQPLPGRQDRVGDNGEVETLAEFRRKYDLYKGDRQLQAMHAAHAFHAIWDDHEVENDYAGTNEGDVVRRDIPFEQRKANGYRSWREHLPLLGDRRIYGRVPLGANADVFLLDERQYRSAQVCEPVTPCPQARTRTDVTLLGAEQKAWLKDELAGSRATWKLLMNQVMVMALDLPTGTPINADQWDGYEAERRELLQHVLDRGIQNVSWLTGDIHTFFAGTVHVDGRVTTPPAATEFVGGSITSSGIADEFGGQQRATDRIRELNPHISYVDTAANGYGIAEARRGELLVTFRSPQSVAVPQSPVRDLARFRVATGSTRVEQL